MVFENLPIAVGVHSRPLWGLQNEPGFITELRHGGQLGEIPNHRRQNITSGVKRAGNIERFITPMIQVARRRAREHPHTVDE